MRKNLFAAWLLLGLLAVDASATSLFDIVTKGSVDRSVTVDIIDSTDGTPENGVVFNTSGIDLWYRREGAARTAITEVTLAALTTAHTDGGFLYVSDGTYRLDLPDAAFATGANYVDFGGTVTGMIVIGGRVRLVDYSLEDSVRLGLTGLANATPGAAGGLLIAGTNADFDVTANSAFAGGITVTQSSSNTAGVAITGNGTGNGITVTSGSGATGTALALVAASTNGTALTATGTGTGNGATFTSGSGATGNGVAMTAASTNGNGLATQGTGTGSGSIHTGGATGDGLEGIGGSTSGAGERMAGTAGNSPGSSLVGQGSAAGLLSTGGATGAGASLVGGSTSGVGLLASGTAGNSAGASFVGQGSAAGTLSTGGATGSGVRYVGGSTSGLGIATSYTAANGGASELGFDVSGTLSGTHSSTTADLGTNAPTTVSDVVGHTLRFPSLNLSRYVTAYDTATGIATFSAIDPDITLTNGANYILFGTAPASGGSGPDAATIADAVWDEATSGHVTAGTTGERLTRIPNAAAGGNGGLPTVNASNYVAGIQVLDEDLTTLDLNATPTGAASSVTGSVGSVTGNVGGNVVGSTGSVTGAVGSVTGAVGSVTGNVGGNVTGTVGGVATGGIVAGSFASNSITAAAAAADLTTELQSGLATSAALATVDTIVDKLDTTVELDGSVYRFTTNALENAPAGGGGGSSDWTAGEKEQIRYRLGIDGVTTAPSTTPTLATAAALTSLTNTVGVAGAGLTAVPYNASWSASIRTALGLATANLDTQLTGIPLSVWSYVVEDQGNVQARCMMALIGAYAAGDLGTSGGTSTWRDANGAEVRITTTISANGVRNNTITCPSY